MSGQPWTTTPGADAVGSRQGCESINPHDRPDARPGLSSSRQVNAVFRMGDTLTQYEAVLSGTATKDAIATACEKDGAVHVVTPSVPVVSPGLAVGTTHVHSPWFHHICFPVSSRTPIPPAPPILPAHSSYFSYFSFISKPHYHVHLNAKHTSYLSLKFLIHSILLVCVSLSVLLVYYSSTTYVSKLVTTTASSPSALPCPTIPDSLQPERVATLIYTDIILPMMILPSWIWRHLLAGSAIASSLFTPTSAASNYVNDAVAAIQELNTAWYDPSTGLWDNAWWNSGNALTILADFTTLRLSEANNLNLGGYIRNTYVQAQKTNVQTTKAMSTTGMTSTSNCINGHGCSSAKRRFFLRKRGFEDFLNEYYDDEGWWALGLIRSFDATGDDDYLDSAVEIFQDMQTGKGTPCGGGIYWSKDRTYVNAIANELYLSVAASLANRVPSNGTYLKIAKSQWEWFQKSGMINSDNLINDGLDAGCKNNGLTTWSYNQGVILGGLSELAIATGDASYLDIATTIANAAINALSNKDGILVEADQCELRPGHCGSDGQQFKGVFVRNLRYLNMVAPSNAFKQFIIRNANSIWEEDRNSHNMLGVAWTGPYINSTGPAHSSALDALVAAVAVS